MGDLGGEGTVGFHQLEQELEDTAVYTQVRNVEGGNGFYMAIYFGELSS